MDVVHVALAMSVLPDHGNGGIAQPQVFACLSAAVFSNQVSGRVVVVVGDVRDVHTYHPPNRAHASQDIIDAACGAT